MLRNDAGSGVGRRARALGGLVVCLWFSAGVARAAPDPSLGPFHILDQLSPADRSEIVRSVQNSLAPGAGATRPDVATQVFGPGDVVWVEVRRPTHESAGPSLVEWLRVDAQGMVELGDGREVNASGLTPRGLTARLVSLPEYAGAVLLVKRLALRRTRGQIFGHGLFLGRVSPGGPGDVRVLPASYELTPGDALVIRVGKASHRVVVGPDGTVIVPGLGPLHVAGLPLAEVEARVARRVHGDRTVAIALVALHQIRISVLGEVRRPGVYFLEPNARVTDALAAAGGPRRSGSVRKIRLERAAHVVGRFDLYRLVLDGDTAENQSLSPGEAVFVPVRGPIVKVTGAVLRPGRYELAGRVTIADLVTLAGGLTSRANIHRALILRRTKDGERQQIAVNGVSTQVTNGDWVRIPPHRRAASDVVWVDGPSGTFARPWQTGERLSAALRPLRNEDMDWHYILILHRKPVAHLFFAQVHWTARGTAARGDHDPTLAPGDRIYLFGLEGGRAPRVTRALDAAGDQAGAARYVATVSVTGAVRDPGRYPLTVSMRVADLVRAAGGVTEAPARLEVLLKTATGRVLGMGSLDSALSGDGARVSDGERLSVVARRTLARIAVSVHGGVAHPGIYLLSPAATVTDALAAAGGLTGAHTRTLVSVSQRAVADRRRAQRGRLIGDVVTHWGPAQSRPFLSLAGCPISGVAAVGVSGSSAIRTTRLRAGAEVTAMGPTHGVMVMGLVRDPGERRVVAGARASDYVRAAGGVISGGDPGHLLRVTSHGALTGVVSHWFYHTPIAPGDTVVVVPRLPGSLSADRAGRLRRLIVWTWFGATASGALVDRQCTSVHWADSGAAARLRLPSTDTDRKRQ